MAPTPTLETLLADWQHTIWELKHVREHRNDFWIVFGYHEGQKMELQAQGKTLREAVRNFAAIMKHLDANPID